MIDLSLKEAFLPHVSAFERATAKVKAAAKTMAEVKKAAKTDGFTVPQIKFAIQCQTPEGEAIAKSLIASNLLAAAYVGADVGTQFTLFLEPDRTPITDRAYREGQSAAMKNDAAAPKYDPSTEAHRFFMQGYHDEQGRQVEAGIGKLDAKSVKANGKGDKSKGKSVKGTGKKRGRPAKSKTPDLLEAAGVPAERVLIKKADKDAKAAKAAPRPADGPPRKPAAQPVTRATLAAAKAAQKDEAESYFTQAKVEGNA